MKRGLLLAILFVAITSFSVNAQVNFGHVSSQKVFDSIPSYQRMVKEQEATLGKIEKEYNQKVKEIQEFEEKLQREGAKMEEFEYVMATKDLEALYEKVQTLEQYQQYQASVFQERFMLLQEMYFEAVQVVADRLGLTYVFDKDQLLYAGPKGRDITSEVIKEFRRMDIEKFGQG